MHPRFPLFILVFLWTLALIVQSVRSSEWFRRTLLAIQLIRASKSALSFYTWSDMIQHHPSLTFTDLTPPGIYIPSEPHIILTNHIRSYQGAASFLTIAGTIHAPANIVCYTKYYEMVFFASTIHSILDGEIQIDSRLSKVEKERGMVDGICRTLASGRNVVMLIDAHRPRSCIRSLNKAVLAYFPTYKKQLIQILEPIGVSEFRYRRFHATYDMEVIYQQRRAILAQP